MRQAGQIVGRMHERIFDKVEPGIRKCDLVAEIYDAALRYDPEIGAGGDYPALVPLLPSGADASAPHLTWDDQPMKSGDGHVFRDRWRGEALSLPAVAHRVSGQTDADLPGCRKSGA